MRRNRLFAAASIALLAAGLGGCGWFSGGSGAAPPQRVQGAPAGDDQRGTPNLGTVPARPQTSTGADRAAVAGQLSSDRARARYGDDARPVDETSGATIGSVVRPKPPGSDKEDKPEGSGPAPDLRSRPVAPPPAPDAAPKPPPRRSVTGAPTPG